MVAFPDITRELVSAILFEGDANGAQERIFFGLATISPMTALDLVNACLINLRSALLGGKWRIDAPTLSIA